MILSTVAMVRMKADDVIRMKSDDLNYFCWWKSETGSKHYALHHNKIPSS